MLNSLLLILIFPAKNSLSNQKKCL